MNIQMHWGGAEVNRTLSEMQGDITELQGNVEDLQDIAQTQSDNIRTNSEDIEAIQTLLGGMIVNVEQVHRELNEEEYRKLSKALAIVYDGQVLPKITVFSQKVLSLLYNNHVDYAHFAFGSYQEDSTGIDTAAIVVIHMYDDSFIIDDIEV